MSEKATAPAEQKTQIIDRLKEVWDPCSCHTSDPINIVDLGLVTEDDIAVKEEGLVKITVRPTTPMCLYMLDITEDIKRRVNSLPTVTETEVIQDTETVWTPERMEEDVRKARRESFEKRVEEHDIEPYYSKK